LSFGPVDECAGVDSPHELGDVAGKTDAGGDVGVNKVVIKHVTE